MPVRFEDSVRLRRSQSRESKKLKSDVKMAAHSATNHHEPGLQHKKRLIHANTESQYAAREPAFQHKRRVELISMSQTDRTQEPPLQRKKRSQSASPVRNGLSEPPIPRRKKSTESRPTSAFGTYFTEPDDHRLPRDELVLLGDQSKFASNIVYHVRQKAALQRELVRQEAATQAESVDRLSIPAARRVVVDTGKPTKRASKSSSAEPLKAENGVRRKDTTDVRQQQLSDDDNRTVSSVIPPTPMAPRGPVPRLAIEDARGVQSTGVQTDIEKRSQQQQQQQEAKLMMADDVRRSYGHNVSSSKLVAAGKPSRNNPEFVIKPTVKSRAVQCAVENNEGDSQAVHRKQAAVGGDTDGKLNVTVAGNKRKVQMKQADVAVNEKGNVNNSSTTIKSSIRNQAVGKQIPADVTEQQRKSIQHGDATEQDDYAAKYRLGLVPQRSRTGPTRKSEYQLQFQWRSFERTSPLIAAQEVVYRSHPDLTSHKLGRVAEEDSEYRSQFQAWTTQSAREDTRAADSLKIKRSRSLKELKSLRAAGKPSQSYSDDEETRRNPERNIIEDGRTSGDDVEASSDVGHRPDINVAANHNNFYPRQSQSEYASNFRAPWKPNKREDKSHSSPNEQPRQDASDWYAGVLELRRNAQEYRQRAFGTHFSREHLAQLSARNAQLWDTVSNSSLTSEPTRAKDRVAAAAAPAVRKGSAESVDSHSVDGSVGSRRDDHIPVTNSKKTPSSDPRKHHHPQQQRYYDENSVVSDNRSVDNMSDDVIVAAEQQAAADDDEFDNDIAAWREQQQRKQPERYHTADVKKSKKMKQEVINSRHNVIVPVKSLHQQKKPIRTDDQTLTDATNLKSQNHNNKHSQNREVGVGSYDVDDTLSSAGLSTSRSLESSCSLANEVLARARSRRDHFWK